MGKAFRIFGMIFFVFGIVILFNSFQSITGAVVFNDIDINTGFIIGAWFILTAVLLLAYRRKEKIESGKRK